MKVSILALVLLLLLPVKAARAERVETSLFNRSGTTATAYWPSASVVNVYFVHNVFTTTERQILWEAIEAWTDEARKMDSAISFVNAGETGGLIDCAACLTITRQGFDINRLTERVSFNPLRQDKTGELISAWIGFERAATTPRALKSLMQQALRRAWQLRSPQHVGLHEQ
jgi:hypothetical protein